MNGWLLTCTVLGTIAAPAAAAAQAAPVDQQARIEALEAQIEALRQSVDALQAKIAESAPATPSWKGAPQLADKESGFSFKPRGRVMVDFAHVDGPDGFANSGLGFSNEIRRGRLGVEGTLPGAFGYKLEMDFAGGDAEFADAYLSHQAGPLELIVGQHNNFQSLEELTSSLHTSFIERAAFTDAFNFERRVGVSAQYATGPVLAQAGLFTDSIADLNELGDDNDSIGVDGRLVAMPKIGGNQLHLAASAHWRDLGDAIFDTRYRQRPAVHSTDVRFIDSGNIPGAERETAFGLEAAGIFGPFHAAGEAYWQHVGRAGGLAEPTFFGAYGEAGYFLTGETRGYKAGKFDRVKVRNPLGEGGPGAISLNVRWDYLDLEDSGFLGGRQNAFQGSLNWKPVDYVLFGLNYALIRYDNAAVPAAGNRDYQVDTLALRSQVDF